MALSYLEHFVWIRFWSIGTNSTELSGEIDPGIIIPTPLSAQRFKNTTSS
jgi:hypothetical protein